MTDDILDGLEQLKRMKMFDGVDVGEGVWPFSDGETDHQVDAEDIFKETIAEIKRLKKEEEAEWRDMDTAPRDGTDIIVWDGEIRTITTWGKVSHVPMYGWLQVAFTDPEDIDFMSPKPIAWKPLPKPPTPQEDKT